MFSTPCYSCRTPFRVQSARARLARLTLVAVLSLLVAAASAAPVVTNVRASQRNDGSGIVDVYYNLSGLAGSALVSLHISNDAGVHYKIIPSPLRLSGDVGTGVTNGTDRHIVWDVLRDRPQINWTQCKARVTASEGGHGGETITLMLPDSAISLEMVRIPAGSFDMGSTFTENEIPVHNVTLSNDFYMGKFEVTQEQWFSIMGANPTQSSRRPVSVVSWDDCQLFITELNTLGLGTFRLPTEAEWEYACRAGSDTKWSFGDDEALLGDYAWFSDYNLGTKPVGLKLPNAFGLYDMYGNVSEWCEDWYGDYTSSSQTDPKGPPYGGYRVFRGGAYRGNAVDCRSAVRYFNTPDGSYYYNGLWLVRPNLGFRLVRTP